MIPNLLTTSSVLLEGQIFRVISNVCQGLTRSDCMETSKHREVKENLACLTPLPLQPPLQPFRVQTLFLSLSFQIFKCGPSMPFQGTAYLAPFPFLSSVQSWLPFEREPATKRKEEQGLLSLLPRAWSYKYARLDPH